jgi:hypothetical protein
MRMAHHVPNMCIFGIDFQLSSYIQSLESKIEGLKALLNKQNGNTDTMGSMQPSSDALLSQPPARNRTYKSLSPTYSSDIYVSPMSPESFQLVPQSRSPPGGEMDDDIEGDVSDVNRHTNSIEFHGSTSSISVLDSVQKTQVQRRITSLDSIGCADNSSSLISALHNSAFSSQTWIAREEGNMQEHRYYFRQAHIFIEGYFESLHFIHPVIDKNYFLSRAQDLWFRKEVQPQPTFVAFYLALLSLGALVRVWDEPTIDGMGRFDWSRKLFKEAEIYLHTRRFHNDLDTVHCLFLMVSVKFLERALSHGREVELR